MQADSGKRPKANYGQGYGPTGMKKFLMVMLAVGFIATAAVEWKKLRTVQERARRILYPGDSREMLKILTELRSHGDPESQTLARQLEDRLQSQGNPQRRRGSRHSG